MEIDLKVIEIGKTEKDRIQAGHEEKHYIKARDALGSSELVIKAKEPFEGFEKNQLIKVKISESEMTYNDYDKVEEKLKEAKKKEKEAEKLKQKEADFAKEKAAEEDAE